MTEVLVGRQPIFNASLELFGYELLYRTVNSEKAEITNGDLATTQVILNTFSEIGLDTLVGSATAFINFTHNFFVGKYPIPFPPNQVVLEVLEDIDLDEEMISSLRNLCRRGYKIALDDVVSCEGISSVAGLVSIVKVDTLSIEQSQLFQLVSKYKPMQVKLLAEKVETQQNFNFYKQLGFDYFQGFFFSRPYVVTRKKLDTSRLIILNTLARLQDPKTDFHILETVISQDIGLSYKLLKLVNSAHYSTASRVKSISQAISYVGMNELRGWLTLFLMASVENKPHELTKTAMVRAKMCELAARAFGYADADSYFMTGLISILDVILDIPMIQVIHHLPISDEIAEALLRHKGKAGRILHAVVAYERGDWLNALKIDLPPEQIRELYLQSIKWSSLFEQAE